MPFPLLSLDESILPRSPFRRPPPRRPAPAESLQPAPAPPAPRPEPGQLTAVATGTRILIVDDMPAVQSMLSDFLQVEGYTVQATGDATDALVRLDSFRPHVVLLDILLPGLSGIGALRQIRATAPQVGVIMVTGNGDDEVARQALALGAFDYLTKPVDFDYLKWSLETFLLGRALLR